MIVSMYIFPSSYKPVVNRILPLLLLAVLASCSISGNELNSAKSTSFSFSALNNNWLGDNSKYQQLANGPLAGELGASLSPAAKRKAIEAEYNALEKSKPGETVIWRYSDLQSGKIIPYSPYQVGSTNCRRYLHTVSVKGISKQATGTACRDESGIWTPLT